MATVQDGYKVVTGIGQPKQSAPGTETANEGAGTGVKWAKRASTPQDPDKDKD